MVQESPLIEAQRKFIDAVPTRALGAERVPLADGLGRTLYSDVQAPHDMPPFHRAIVEGFLVHTADTSSATEDAPAVFEIVGEVQPGDAECPRFGKGQAVRVVTGSVVPGGDYSAVRMWDAQLEDSRFSVSRPFPPRFFLEDQGCETRRGDVVVAGGVVLGPEQLGTIASLGLDAVEVSRIPRVTIFSSGNELVPYTEEIRPGVIRDSNSVMLSSAVVAGGGQSVPAGIMADDFDEFVTAARSALEASDMLLISGGTAVGGRDFISDLVKMLGELLVDGVPMKSGRPLIMGVAGQKPIVCVAGHPPEALRGFRLFGQAALDALLGRDAPLPMDAPSPA